MKWILGLIVTIGFIAIMVFIAYMAIAESEAYGYCKGRGYDGQLVLRGERHCYLVGDDYFIAVPISVLKGE